MRSCMICKSNSDYPKSSNLQTQNPELTVIWSEPQTVVDSLKQLLVILNLWWFLCYE